MADNNESAPDAQEVSFKVRTSGDKSHTITMSEASTVLDLKNKLATEEYENIPIERQRLIYSGRVMKNDDALSVYKIKAGNTIHLVKSAASNPTPPANPSGSAPTPAAVPQNMAAGTSANNLLAGLTGARFAGHANLPSADMFGADGGMGAPPSEDQMADMLSNPAVAQTMNEALNNPAFVDLMIQSNPMLANMPNAREMLQSPGFRNMMTNPDAIRMAARMRRMMGGNNGNAFPAPGATDTTPDGAAAAGADGGHNEQMPPFMPGMFGFPGAAGAPGAAGGANPFATLFGPGNPFAMPTTGAESNPSSPPPAGQTAAATGENRSATAAQGTPAAGGAANPAAGNPFAALFGAPGAQGALAPGGNPFGLPPITPEAMQQMMQAWGNPGSPPPPADNRPPEERYAEQLRQLNDMGFYDFERNVAALRRSGGSVQGAIEHLLSG